MTNETPPSGLDGFSEDQRAATALLAAALAPHGVEIAAPAGGAADGSTVAVLGKAGSGKTHLLAWLVAQLLSAGARQITGEAERDRERSAKAKAAGRAKAAARGRKASKPAKSGGELALSEKAKPKDVSFAVVAPTNKAVSVLRSRGVAAATIHRILYSPLYAPEYEALGAWLQNPDERDPPEDVEGLTPAMLERAQVLFKATKSAPAALAAIGLRGSDFITGWKRRDERISIGLVDEASMLDDEQLADLEAIFDLVVLFGDPAQLAPVMQNGAMAFDRLAAPAKIALARVHRQAADNPIIDLAYALQDDIAFDVFEQRLREIAARDARVTVAPRLDSDVMARAPALVWRNATRIRLIGAFRKAHGLEDGALAPGEPLICDGLELPMRNRNKRVDLEQAGLVKGAQAFWLGPGRRPNFAQLHVPGAPQPQIGVAAIIQIEQQGGAEPHLASAASQGAVFVHGAACTAHKAQGSQWPVVQVFAPDIAAAAFSGRIEAGAPLWRRLAYVAITRAEERLIWATRYMISRPKKPLDAEDLVEGPLV